MNEIERRQWGEKTEAASMLLALLDGWCNKRVSFFNRASRDWGIDAIKTLFSYFFLSRSVCAIGCPEKNEKNYKQNGIQSVRIHGKLQNKTPEMCDGESLAKLHMKLTSSSVEIEI